MKDGNVVDWYYLDTPKSTIVVPITAKNKLILLRQYRYNIKQFVYEFPAGTPTKNEKGTFINWAKDELLEETGYQAGKLIDLGKYYNLPSETNRWTKIYLGLNCTKIGKPKLDSIIEKYFEMSTHLIDLNKLLLIQKSKKPLLKGAEHVLAYKLATEYLQKIL